MASHVRSLTALQVAALCALALGGAAFAQASPSQFFTVEYPKGWKVQTERDGSTSASPSVHPHSRSVSVQYCNRLTQSDCQPGCDIIDMRSRYLVTSGQPGARYSERKRMDGYVEIHESSNYSGSPGWIANAAVCGNAGIVIVGATSVTSRKEAVALVNGIFSSLKWRTQPPSASER